MFKDKKPRSLEHIGGDDEIVTQPGLDAGDSESDTDGSE